MTGMSPKEHNDADQVKAVSNRILATPELAGMLDELAAASSGDINALVRGVLQAFINRGFAAELDSHLGYGNGERDTKAMTGQRNSFNGSYIKTVDTHYGPVDINLPRDRDGCYVPMMVPKAPGVSPNSMT